MAILVVNTGVMEVRLSSSKTGVDNIGQGLRAVTPPPSLWPAPLRLASLAAHPPQ